MEAAAGTRSVSLSAARSTLRPRLAPRWEQAARPALEAIRQSARNDFGRLHAPLRKPHFLILHPGCGTRSKQWPASYWTKLIELCQALGRPLVLTGSAQERSLCARIIEPAPSSHPVLNLAGQTDWGMLAGIVAAADALVAPDTGVIHLAHALGTPSVALFGPIDPALWGYQSTRHRSLAHRLPCSFCREAACALVPGAQPSPCMEAITPAEVWDELQRLLEPHSARMAAAACTNFSMPSPNTASGGNRLATR